MTKANREYGALRPFSIIAGLRLSLFLIIVAVSIAASALILANEAAKTKSDFEAKAETSIRYLSSILELPIWNLDRETVAIIGDALFRDEDIAALRITGIHGISYYDESRPVKADIAKQADITHAGEGIGRAEVVLTYRNANARVLGFLAKMVAAMLAIVLVTIFLAGKLIRKYLSDPLDYLTRIVSAYAEGGFPSAEGVFPIVEFQAFSRVVAEMATKILGQLSGMRELNAELEESLSEKNALLRELYHRTKNNMQVICSMLSMKSDQLSDEAAKNAFEDIASRIYSMALVHEMLYESHSLSSIDLAKYLAELLDLLGKSRAGTAKEVAIRLELSTLNVSIEKAIPIGLIVTELVTNSMRHAFEGRPGGSIRASLSSEGGRATLVVSDDGVGLPPRFDWRASRSMGLRIIRTLADQLGGSVEIEGADGVTCRIAFTE
jgi:two-component sensor histidine kinase